MTYFFKVTYSHLVFCFLSEKSLAIQGIVFKIHLQPLKVSNLQTSTKLGLNYSSVTLVYFQCHRHPSRLPYLDVQCYIYRHLLLLLLYELGQTRGAICGRQAAGQMCKGINDLDLNFIDRKRHFGKNNSRLLQLHCKT